MVVQVAQAAVASRRRAPVAVLVRASLDRARLVQVAGVALLVVQAVVAQVGLLLVAGDRVGVDNVLPSARVADVGATSKSSSRRN